MTTRHLILISLVIFPILAHSQNKKSDSGRVVVEHVHLEDIQEEPVFPTHIKSKFKTLQDWLFNICDNDKPKKSITEYKFGLFESANGHTLFFVGVNKYDEGKNRYRTRIEFEPSSMYFKLRKSEYENLNREQLLDKLTSQLTNFTNTEKFKTSFLSKANAIIFESNGRTIWSK